jgi:hypothetical protein
MSSPSQLSTSSALALIALARSNAVRVPAARSAARLAGVKPKLAGKDKLGLP